MDPSAEAPATTPAPTGADQAAAAEPAAPTPSGGTSDHEAVVIDGGFRMEDVPEAARPYVEARVKELQGDYTRKTQSLAEQRRELAEIAELKAQLASDSEDTRLQAIQSLLEPLGIELDLGEEEPPAEPAPGQEPDPWERVAQLEQRLEAYEQGQSEAQQRAEQEERLAALSSHVEDALEAFAESKGEGFELSDFARQAIVGTAAGLERLPNGMPDMDGAIALYEAEMARITGAGQQPAVDPPPVPDLTGSSGSQQIDLRDRKTRMARAEAAAEQVYARHA